MKKLNQIVSLVVLLTLFACSSIAQVKPKKKKGEFIVNLGQATTNTLTKAKAGQFMGTYPKSDTLKDSWLADMYVELGYRSANLFQIAAVTELHRNNLVAKEQKLFQVGVTVGKDFVKLDDQGYSRYRFITEGNLKHSNDMVKKDKAFQGNVSVNFSFEENINPWLDLLKVKTLVLNNSKGLGKFLNFDHDHSVGLGFIGGPNSVLLGEFAVEVSAYPFTGLLDRWFGQPELLYGSFSLNGRTPFLGKSDLDLRALRVHTVGLKYLIEKKKSEMGISYSRKRGADPFTRLANQDVAMFSVDFKLAISTRK